MAKEKKQEILNAASKVFFLSGFEKTKIEDIAKEAGIGKGTVYEYFDSKQQLFEEMIAFNHRVIIDRLQATLAESQVIREKLKAFASFMTEMLSRHIHLFGLMAGSPVMAREMGAIILESNIRMSDVLAKAAEEAMSQGEIRSDLDPELIASMIMGTVNQYCSKKIIFFHQQPADIDYDQLVDVMMEGIGKKEALTSTQPGRLK